jgi:RimJ/RimL family protein N-acetyltransferase
MKGLIRSDGVVATADRPRGSVHEMLRHRYVANPSTLVPVGGALPNGLRLRQPRADDTEALAELMMSAYIGTIDYHEETVEDAGDEVARWFAAEPYRATSLVAVDGDRLVSGVLNSLIDGNPLIGYVMTTAERKGRGLARALVATAVQSIFADGHEHVSAWVTDGNVPSERLFARLGFVVAAGLETERI